MLGGEQQDDVSLLELKRKQHEAVRSLARRSTAGAVARKRSERAQRALVRDWERSSMRIACMARLARTQRAG